MSLSERTKARMEMQGIPEGADVNQLVQRHGALLERVEKLERALKKIASDDCMIAPHPDYGSYIDAGIPQRIARKALEG